MGHWLRGVGGASPDQGVELHEARVLGLPSEGGCGGTPRPSVGGVTTSAEPRYRPVFLEGEEAPVLPPGDDTVLASEAREQVTCMLWLVIVAWVR